LCVKISLFGIRVWCARFYSVYTGKGLVLVFVVVVVAASEVYNFVWRYFVKTQK
jgi:hypothetical protein